MDKLHASLSGKAGLNASMSGNASLAADLTVPQTVGMTDHRRLNFRDAPDQHPIAAIMPTHLAIIANQEVNNTINSNNYAAMLIARTLEQTV